MRLKRRQSKPRLFHDVITRFDGQLASAIKIDVLELPIALYSGSLWKGEKVWYNRGRGGM